MSGIQATGIIFLSLFLGLILYQIVATRVDDHCYPPLGELVDIGGYKLHLNTRGDGNVTVICEAGLSGTSLGWSLVQAEVAQFARVCSYDRAGYAWSDPSPLKRTSLNSVHELRQLLIQARIPGPYILVGHSFGGANMLLFADLYPDETFGVILVDSVHEDYLKELPTTPQGFLGAKVQWLLSAVGYKRWKGPSQEIEKMFLPLPENIRKAYVAQMNKTLYAETVLKEMSCLDESLAQLERRGIHLQCPLTVITAGILSDGEEGNKWRLLQKKLLSKSQQSKQIIADKSDHMINHHQPRVIVDAIREMEKMKR